MPNPTPEKITVSLDSMSKVAQTWYNMSGAMTTASNKAAGLKEITRLEAGPFQYVHQAYINCATFWWNRISEGATEFDLVGDTLAQVRETYRREEEQHAHEIRNLY